MAHNVGAAYRLHLAPYAPSCICVQYCLLCIITYRAWYTTYPRAMSQQVLCFVRKSIPVVLHEHRCWRLMYPPSSAFPYHSFVHHPPPPLSSLPSSAPHSFSELRAPPPSSASQREREWVRERVIRRPKGSPADSRSLEWSAMVKVTQQAVAKGDLSQK